MKHFTNTEMRHLHTIGSQYLTHLSSVDFISGWPGEPDILLTHGEALSVWNLKTQTRIYHQDIGRGSQVGISKPSRIIALAPTNERSIGILEVRRGWEHTCIFKKKLHSNHLSGISISESGVLIATTSYDRHVKLTNTDTGITKRIEIHAPTGLHHCDHFTAIDEERGHIFIWGTLKDYSKTPSHELQFAQVSSFQENKNVFYTFTLHPTQVTCKNYDTASGFLMVGLSSGAICLIDSSTGIMTTHDTHHNEPISSIAFSDGCLHIAYSNGYLSKWNNTLSEHHFSKRITTGKITALHVNDASCITSCGTEQGTVIQVSSSSGENVFNQNHFGSVYRVGFHNSETISALHSDGLVRSYRIGISTVPCTPLNSSITKSLAISKGSLLLATVSAHNILKLGYADTGTIKLQLPLSLESASAMCIDRSGAFIISVGHNGRLSVVDIPNRVEHQSFLEDMPRDASLLIADMLAGIIVIAGWDKVTFYRQSSGAFSLVSSHSLPAREEIWGLCWKGNSNDVVLGVSKGKKGGLRIIDLNGDISSKTFCSMQITCVVSDTSGRCVYAGTNCGNIIRWCTADRDSNVYVPEAHCGTVVCIDMDQNNLRIASGGVDGTIHVVELMK